MKRAKTKDEMFMIRIYEEATRRNEIEGPIDRYLIGKLAGLHPKGVDTICTLLLQANFLKKCGPTEVSLTPHGLKLVQTLLEEG